MSGSGNRAWDIIEDVFGELGYPYLRQGSLQSKDDYPKAFYTFWNIGDFPRMDYDDRPRMIESQWSICSYTGDPAELYAMLNAFILKCLEKNAIIGAVQDVDSDRADYYGRNVTVTLLIKE